MKYINEYEISLDIRLYFLVTTKNCATAQHGIVPSTYIAISSPLIRMKITV